MESTIKEIIADFIRVPADRISPSTPIDRTALKSSIVLHRMYAKLSEAGLKLSNYTRVRTYGDLQRLMGQPSETSRTGSASTSAAASSAAASSTSSSSAAPNPAAAFPAASQFPPSDPANAGVGLDIEEIAAMPRAADFRRDDFYTMNFAPAEISYCILQADPYASFAGLFAVKEAIVKADGQFLSKPFNTIEIGHTAAGKPVFPGFNLSISHAGNMAAGMAVPVSPAMEAHTTSKPETSPAPQAKKSGLIAWMALLLSVIALCIILIRRP